MKISVAIQYFNRKSLLLRTLNSFLHTQVNLNDIEIIIFDDASDDIIRYLIFLVYFQN
jgi:glycosyltransferase involved in cell wall biosynthesis